MNRHIFPFDNFPGTSVFDLRHVTDIERATVEVTWTADQRFYNLEETFRILCFFWSSAPGDEGEPTSFTSRLFELGSPLEDAFPAAEKIVCHANFIVDYEHEALLLTEYDNGRLEMRDVPAIPRDGDEDVVPTRFKDTKQLITKVKVMHVPDPRTVCQIMYQGNRPKQVVFLRLGEAHLNDEGGWIPFIYCYVD